jgi:hypothetical protein
VTTGQLAWIAALGAILATVAATILSTAAPVSVTWLSREQLASSGLRPGDEFLVIAVAASLVVGVLSLLVAFIVVAKRRPSVADFLGRDGSQRSTERVVMTVIVLVGLPIVLAIRLPNPIGPAETASGLYVAYEEAPRSILRVVALVDVAREFVWSLLVTAAAAAVLLAVSSMARRIL